ncbi:MAG: coenzyme transferase [Myxococcales bacterium]|nr:coenzyme transferase [Myxococcales bacterium]
MTGDFTLADVCAVACAEAFCGDGEILASPIGLIPTLGARLARATFAPELLLTDGVARLVDSDGVVEGWMPYRSVFDVVWSGRRHVLMGATQIDRYGNQNIAAIGDYKKPRAQLLGPRGAPGNTINHATSYFVPQHSTKVFVERVDYVCGLGYDRAAALGEGGRFHEIRRVITNLGVFDFQSADRTMRLRSIHPGVRLDDVVARTGFVLVVPPDPPTSRAPTVEELALLRRFDPESRAERELRS